MTDHELFQQALDDLLHVSDGLECLETIKLLTARVAQPEPKPVAWMWDVYNGAGFTSRGIDFFPTNIPVAKHTPLYTAPPKKEWIGLTNEEKKAICQEAANEDWTDLDVINATEAKLNEKNHG